MDISDSLALVTGGARRIGRGLVLELARRGADVAVHYNTSEDDASETATLARDEGVSSYPFDADLSEVADCGRLWDEVCSRFGRAPSVLVNSASFYPRGSFDVTDAAMWDLTMSVNVRAPFLLAQAMARSLLRRDRDDVDEDADDYVGSVGQIVSINDSRRVYRSRFAYGVSSVALTGLTRSLAVSLSPAIQVNEVLLGPVLPPSDAADRSTVSFDKGSRRDRVESRGSSGDAFGPSGRMGSVSEVARAVLSLIENEYINGASLHLDGGLNATR